MEEIDIGQKNILWQLFTTLDTQKLGYLTRDQVTIAVQSEGFQPEFTEDVEQFDFASFCEQFRITSRPKDREETMKKLLKCLDSNFNGHIQLEDIERILGREQSTQIFADLGFEEGDEVTIDEFARRLYRM